MGKLSTVVAKKPAYYNNRPEGDFGFRSPFAAASVKLRLVDLITGDRRFYERKTALRGSLGDAGGGGSVKSFIFS